VALGDLNGDGKLDVVAGNADANTISVFYNEGNGTFSTQSTRRAGTRGASPSPI
jgi:hypothetical protein